MADASSHGGGTPLDPATMRDSLKHLIESRMPFGKYKGWRLVHLPEPYVVWFRNQGLPRGRLGQDLQEIYDLYQAGLAPLLRSLAERIDRGDSGH
jgi:hypothetical protein